MFEADLEAGELRRQGRLVHVQQQPFDVLRALVEHAGQVVTREALHKRLWPDGVTVDFDQSLNKSITKLRDALGDTADSPRFIETLPKRGYRFIASVERPDVATPSPLLIAVPSDAPDRHAMPARPVIEPHLARWSPVRWLPLAGLAAVLVALASATARQPQADFASPGSVLAPSVPAMSTDAQAVDAYERGRIAASRRSAESLRAAVTNFERALALDTRFAAAYVALADAHSLMASDGMEDPRQAMPLAREAANRALTLVPGLAAAHASLGRTTMLFDWDWQVAVWHFERARAAAPEYGVGRQWFAQCYSAMTQHADAEKEARAALALNPLGLPENTTLGYVLYAAKRYAGAEAQLRRALEIDPGHVHARRILGLTLLLAGRPGDAVSQFDRALQLSGNTPSAIADLAMARGRAGDAPGARRLLTQLTALQERSSFVAPDGIAQVHWGLGDHDAAVEWLQKAYAARVPTVAHLMADPLWDDLRRDPRVGAMIEGIRTGKAPAAPLP